ncbi:TIGR00266 family protein [Lysobacter sp. TY2-98]|uniref:TIGR00266 family protein n=1 Tax=Lysobacter sp. TY2-98 TaxID=2290922 RepID=UPI000E1FF397|nr:TIGR00266 family protein [Lysobacter sp. TY2-98]AXK73714.1 TIGR00266 family protein [Lysobacter sp. TY2-98]
MSQWFFVHPQTSERVGPLDPEAAFDFARQNPNHQCWREGLSGWQPVRAMPEFAEAVGAQPSHVPPPPPPGFGARGSADDIDYRIVGNDMPFVEIELDPGESAIAEAGALMYKDGVIQMDTIFGDGSKAGGGGIGDKLFAAARRVVTGESLFTTVFTHQGQGKARVAFAAPYPGTVLPIRLSDHGGTLICQKDSFLAGARGVRLGIFFQKKILTGLFGGEGFVMQRLDGDGWVFVHAGGTLVERDLAPGERIDVDTGCVMAFHPTVNMDIRPVGGIKSMLFGGEGVFLATLTGPGKVWLQSLPFSRMAGRMLAAAPQGGGKNVGEGSVLGGLGRLLDGDNGF